MASSRYLNLQGSDNIADTYEDIDEAFALVEGEMDQRIATEEDLQAQVTDEEAARAAADTAHANSTTAHPAEHIPYAGSVTGAENAKEALDILQTQLDAAIIEGDSSPAAAQAAVDASGHDYGNLKVRLDTEHTGIVAQLAEEAQQRQAADAAEAQARSSAVAALEEGKATRVELGVQAGRIDLLLTNPGSTTGDLALVDIAKAADGNTYGSPGTSVRAQINQIDDMAPIKKSTNLCSGFTDGLSLNADGSTSANAGRAVLADILVIAGTTYYWRAFAAQTTLTFVRVIGYNYSGTIVDNVINGSSYTPSAGVVRMVSCVTSAQAHDKIMVATAATGAYEAYYTPRRVINAVDRTDIAGLAHARIGDRLNNLERFVGYETPSLSFADNVSVSPSGALHTYEAWYTSPHIPCKHATKLMVTQIPFFSGLVAPITFFDDNGTFLSSASVAVYDAHTGGWDKELNGLFPVPTGAASYRVSKFNNGTYISTSRVITYYSLTQINARVNALEGNSKPFDTDKMVMFRKVFCLGDSLTEGDYGSNTPGVANVKALNYPYFMSLFTRGGTVVNEGVSGSNLDTVSYKIVNTNFTTAKYDAVVIMTGTNLTPDEPRYSTRINKILTESPNTLVFICTIPYTSKRTMEFITTTNDVIRGVVTTVNNSRCILIDVYNLCGMDATNGAKYRPIDDLHFGRAGYYQLAMTIMSVMTQYADMSVVSE